MISKKKYLKHLASEIFFRIKPSSIHGVGIFSVKRIPKNTNPLKLFKPIKWIKFKKSDLRNLPQQIKTIINNFYSGDEANVWLPENGLNVFDISHYINHSNKPNMVTNDGGENFKTIRDIKTGEELTADYRTYY